MLRPIPARLPAPSGGSPRVLPRPPQGAPGPRRAAGFTLVELLIVVVILAILSAVALPQIGSQRTEAVASTLQSSVTQVVMLLEHQKQKSQDGGYPAAIDPDWFVSGKLPLHPDQMAGVPSIETVHVPNLQHPRIRLIQPGSAGAYWYNSKEGIFRARVKAQKSWAETSALYDLVNGIPASASPAATLDPEPLDEEPGLGAAAMSSG